MKTYRRIRTDATDWFAPDEVQKAKRYQRPLTVARITSTVVELAVLLVLVSVHAAPRLADATAGGSWPLRLLVVLVGLMIAFTILDLPFSIWTTFVHDRKWEFSTQTAKGFVLDELKGLVVGLVFQAPLLLALWWLIRTTDLWWLAGWAVFLVFNVLLVFLYPIVIAPIFNKFVPLEDEELADRLRSLAASSGMRVSGVQVMDASKRTRKDNAFFAGMGSSRRIVVFDNLLKYAPGSIASVVAHELGHWRRRHVARSVALATFTSLAMFGVLRSVASWDAALNWAGVDSIRDPVALPLVLLFFATTSAVTAVVVAWLSRAYERQADLDALEITQDYDAFIEAERELSTKNLIDLAPSWWSYLRASHPPPAERMQFARLWKAERESAGQRKG